MRHPSVDQGLFPAAAACPPPFLGQYTHPLPPTTDAGMTTWTCTAALCHPSMWVKKNFGPPMPLGEATRQLTVAKCRRRRKRPPATAWPGPSRRTASSGTGWRFASRAFCLKPQKTGLPVQSDDSNHSVNSTAQKLGAAMLRGKLAASRARQGRG